VSRSTDKPREDSKPSSKHADDGSRDRGDRSHRIERSRKEELSSRQESRHRIKSNEEKRTERRRTPEDKERDHKYPDDQGKSKSSKHRQDYEDEFRSRHSRR